MASSSRIVSPSCSESVLATWIIAIEAAALLGKPTVARDDRAALNTLQHTRSWAVGHLGVVLIGQGRGRMLESIETNKYATLLKFACSIGVRLQSE